MRKLFTETLLLYWDWATRLFSLTQNLGKLHFHTAFRLGLLLPFLIGSHIVDQAQILVDISLRPSTQIITIFLSLLLYLIIYRWWGDGFGRKGPFYRWCMTLPALLASMIMAGLILITIGQNGELWMFRVLSLAILASGLTHLLAYSALGRPSHAYFAFREVTFLVALVAVTIIRQTIQWQELAAFLYGYEESTIVWCLWMAGVMSTVTVVLSVKGIRCEMTAQGEELTQAASD